MFPDQLATLLAAAVGGGALFKFLEVIALQIFNRGKTVRDELRAEIARLEGIIRSLETKVDTLETEVEDGKRQVDSWRDKYYGLVGHAQQLEVTIEAKDYTIRVLEDRLARMRSAVTCKLADKCPLLPDPTIEKEPDNGAPRPTV